MKKFFAIFLTIILGVGIGMMLWKFFFAPKKESSTTSTSQRQVTAENYTEPFMWGISVNLSPVRKYSLEMWNKQMKLVNELGASWIRLGYSYGAPDKYQIFDEVFQTADSRGIQVYFALDSSEPVTDLKNPYEDGYKVASDAAEHYKDKVRYWQILNEVGGTAIKGAEFSGENESDFDPQKYENVREWSKGAIAALRKIDPDAYIVMDFHWTHYRMVEMLIRDKVDFDIIGWHWYADMKMMGDKKLNDGTMLADKLQSYDKPILLTEVNGMPAKTKGKENNQAEFIQQMADWAYNSKFIKGFFVHELVDIAPTADRPEGYFGLIEFKKASDGGYTYGDPKKAFYIYQEIIKKYTQ